MDVEPNNQDKMNFFPAKYYLLLLCLVSLSFSCSKDSDEADQLQEQLIGKWEVIEAYRNGNLAESLDDLFFEFYGDGHMRTNISGTTQKAEYHIEGEIIQQKAGEDGLELEYAINGISDSTLSLSTDLRRYQFKFELGKAIQIE